MRIFRTSARLRFLDAPEHDVALIRLVGEVTTQELVDFYAANVLEDRRRNKGAMIIDIRRMEGLLDADLVARTADLSRRRRVADGDRANLPRPKVWLIRGDPASIKLIQDVSSGNYGLAERRLHATDLEEAWRMIAGDAEMPPAIRDFFEA